MSAFIVSNETMQTVVYAVMNANASDVVGPLAKLRAEGPEAVGNALLRMNTRAVNSRYCERTRAPTYEHGSEWFSLIDGQRFPAPSEAQQFKSIACLSYQCSEGKVPNSALFKALHVLKAEIAIAVAHASPAVKSSVWG